MAATDIVFNGLAHMIGQSVEVVIGGLDCGAFTVSSAGTVTVPLASIPVPGNYPDAGTYLQTLDVGSYDTTTYGDATMSLTMQINGGGIATMYLPIYIGFTYPSVLQGLRPTSSQVNKSPEGGSTGKLRRELGIGVLVQHTQGIQLGTQFGNLIPADFKLANGQSFPNNVLYDGVHYQVMEDDDTFDGMTMVYAAGPYPCVVLSLTGFLETKERD